MRQLFEQFIQKHSLCTRDLPVYVAVSGGIDSIVLLHLFKTGGYNVTAAHVNFGLRGAESDEDEAFVKRFCEHWGIVFLAKRVLTKNYATEKGISIQMAARDLRYEWFSELIRSAPESMVATAHHVNDSGETMLLNLVRGTGIDGLTGIPVKNNGIIRPLSFASREDINQYASEHKIEWREDRSNTDDRYQRNFLRLNVFPLLTEINPSLDETLSRNFERLGAERELMEKALAVLKETFVSDGNIIRIPKKVLEGSTHKAGLLLRMIEEFGFNFSNAESIVAASHTGKMFFSKTHQLAVDRDDFIVSSLISELPYLVFEESSDITFTNDPNIAYLDADKLRSLNIRKWRDGDSFQPIGMKGNKKVSDYLVDEKISMIEKQSIMILTSDEQIVWVVGKRIDDRFKITSQTTRVLRVIKTKRPVE